MISFKDIELKDKELITSYTQHSPRRNCDLSFSNLCSWRFLYDTKFAVQDGFLILKFWAGEKLVYMMPVGNGDLKKVLEDMIEELLRPGRDMRDSLPKPLLRTDVLDMKDLTPGMQLTGTVRNVIDFGAFVDIGVHQDGLHISQISSRFIRHPSEVLKVGDVVTVWVLSVDLQKKRIALTMKQPKTEQAH